MDLQPLKTFRASSNQASLLQYEGRTFLVKRYAGTHPQERRNCEEQALQAWGRAGFNVPQLAALDLPELRHIPHLAMTYLAGSTLQEYLQKPGPSMAAKLALLTRIFEANCRRHLLACRQQQPELLHPDPNSSNVLLVHDEFFFIDFETKVATRPLEEAAAIEAAKFCRWTARDLGSASLPEVVERMVAAYRAQPGLLRRIVSRTCERPFQFFHRWQDRRRKQRQPQEVTKYDIADALAQALARLERRPS